MAVEAQDAYGKKSWGEEAWHIGHAGQIVDGAPVKERYGFARLLQLNVAGFIVDSCLPFTLVLLLTAITAVLPFPHSLILVAIGLGLVRICHLPLPFRARLGMLSLVC